MQNIHSNIKGPDPTAKYSAFQVQTCSLTALLFNLQFNKGKRIHLVDFLNFYKGANYIYHVYLGSVVKNIISLMSLLMTLTVVAKVFPNTLIFLYSHFFSKKYQCLCHISKQKF